MTALAIGVGAAPIPAAAADSEVLYLTDSGSKTNGTTALFRVELDEATGRADLTLAGTGYSQ